MICRLTSSSTTDTTCSLVKMSNNTFSRLLFAQREVSRLFSRLKNKGGKVLSDIFDALSLLHLHQDYLREYRAYRATSCDDAERRACRILCCRRDSVTANYRCASIRAPSDHRESGRNVRIRRTCAASPAFQITPYVSMPSTCASLGPWGTDGEGTRHTLLVLSTLKSDFTHARDSLKSSRKEPYSASYDGNTNSTKR